MRKSKNIGIFLSLLLISFLLVSNSNAQQPTASVPLVPRLQIDIPTVSFSQPAAEAGYLNLPFLAEYIIGLSKYLVAITGVLAGIMVTIGGVQYLLAAGNKSAIDVALKRIKGALIGMGLVLGSYLILYTVNPELVKLRTLEIKKIETINLDFSSLSSFSVNEEQLTPAPAGRRSGNCRIPPPDIFKRPKGAELQLNRINIKGENETRCPGGLIYPRNLVDAVLAAQRETGIPAGFLLAQAQHEGGRGFVSAISRGEVPTMLWGRKCPNINQGGVGKDVWKDSHPVCSGARQPSAEQDLRSACTAAGCQVLATREWCNQEAGRPSYPAWACFANFTDPGGAATHQAKFYRDTIGGRFCQSCGPLSSFEGSVMGFAARMSCVLLGGVHNDKWDNCLYMTIRKNCLEDSRNADLIRASEILGAQGSCVGGTDTVNTPDPYDVSRIPTN